MLFSAKRMFGKLTEVTVGGMERRTFKSLVLLLCLFSAVMFACGQSSESNILKVKVMSLKGCGATQPTIALVKETARELNLQIDFEYVAISSLQEALQHRHIGSPTVHINGVDIEPDAREATNFGVMCRDYGGTEIPPREMLKSALFEAIESQ